MRLSPPKPAMKAIPTVWDEVCKAFTQLGADPDLALGAASQEKSPLENSQLLVCVRSGRALLRLRAPLSPLNIPIVSPWEGTESGLHVPEGISVLACSVSACPGLWPLWDLAPVTSPTLGAQSLL